MYNVEYNNFYIYGAENFYKIIDSSTTPQATACITNTVVSTSVTQSQHLLKPKY